MRHTIKLYANHWAIACLSPVLQSSFICVSHAYIDINLICINLSRLTASVRDAAFCVTIYSNSWREPIKNLINSTWYYNGSRQRLHEKFHSVRWLLKPLYTTQLYKQLIAAIFVVNQLDSVLSWWGFLIGSPQLLLQLHVELRRVQGPLSIRTTFVPPYHLVVLIPLYPRTINDPYTTNIPPIKFKFKYLLSYITFKYTKYKHKI